MNQLECLARRYDETLMRRVVDALTDANMSGYPIAGYRLGMMCEKRNFERAMDYYVGCLKPLRKIAKGGEAEAALCLAEIYHYGRGVDENESQAQKWLKLAVVNGSERAKSICEQWEKDRRGRNANILLAAMTFAENAHQ